MMVRREAQRRRHESDGERRRLESISRRSGLPRKAVRSLQLLTQPAQDSSRER
jgi:hypothetical protein